MKTFTISINFALICFLSGVENASAWGFSFTNFLMKVGVCNPGLPGPLGHGCNDFDCSKMFPPTNYCENPCTSTSDRRLDESSDSSNSTSSSINDFQWTQAACANIRNYNAYQSCMRGASLDCAETTLDGNETYAPGENYYEDYIDGTSSSNGSMPTASRTSLLPFIIAATVATMFLVLYVWRQNVSIRDPLMPAEYSKQIGLNLQ